MLTKSIQHFYIAGGPQSALTQFYSFRWNFQLMAANGYIVVAQIVAECQATEWSGMNKSVKTGADR
jgi:hypothetical protein